MARPGIVFETVPPPTPDALPRMDVAAFVGFADAGPVDVAVPIEDMAHFRGIFGDDPELAFDAQLGQMQLGYLGATVEAFFANGGRRCWVVRVADSPERAQFVLPGISSTQLPAGPFDAGSVIAPARSPGIWAEDLRAHSTLIEAPLIPTTVGAASALDLSVTNGVQILSLSIVSAPGAITVGQTVRVQTPDASSLGARQIFFVVESIASLNRALRLSSSQWLMTDVVIESPPADPALRSPALTVVDRSTLDPQVLSQWTRTQVRADLLTFELSVWQEDTLQARIVGLEFSPRHPRFWGNLPDDEDLFWRDPVHRADGRDDEVLALWNDAGGNNSQSSVQPGQRFAVAGPQPVQLSASPWPWYLPSAMSKARVPAPYSNLDAPLRSGLETISPALFVDSRLINYAGESLLRSAEVIANEARDSARRQRVNPPDRLRGIHALLSIDEVTMIATPDVIHRGWGTQTRSVDDILDAPELVSASVSISGDELLAEWTRVEEATSYQLQISPAPDFATTESEYSFDDVPSSLGTTDARVARPIDCAEVLYLRVNALRNGAPSPWSNTRRVAQRPGDFRRCTQLDVDVTLQAQQGRWSTDDPSPTLEWTPSDGAVTPGAPFEVESAGDVLFLTAQSFVKTTDRRIRLPEVGEGPRYWRVRVSSAGGLSFGPWSNTVVWIPVSLTRPVMDPAPGSADGATFDDTLLLSTHRGLLRFCHARGDLLALLSLPRHYGPADVEQYLSALSPDDTASVTQLASQGTSGAQPLTFAEGVVLSYGAVYYPWLAHSLEPGSGTRAASFIPCDGAASGHHAQIAVARGAWIAAANHALPGVLATEPRLLDQQMDRLHDLQINIVLRAPSGFVFMDDLTLSQSTDTVPISVRRLLILLKRLALREGAGLVFEPNDTDLQERVYTDFERVLSMLHQRGAFKGTDASDAFEVIADTTVNPQESIDAGKFVVELRVAPSEPLKFLRVRLVQSGPQSISVGEA